MAHSRVESDVSKFLENIAGEKFEIQDRLVDGNANFLYRIASNSGKTYILKHAEPFIKTNPGFAFPTQRMDFESGILQKLPGVLPADDVVQPVKVITYDSESHNLVLSDGGSQNLKAAYSDAGLDIQFIGNALGKWIAHFHESTKDLQFGDNQLAKSIYRFSYNGLANAQKEFGLDPKLGEQVNSQFGSLLATDEGSVCHGDFWTGNVIVKLNPTRLTIVDWEISRRGNGVTDVAQFAAESWLLDRFRGGKGLLDAFLEAYVNERKEKLSSSDLQRIVVHFAVHISFWPTSVEWADKEGTLEMVKLGYEYLQRGVDKDWDWLQKSDLKKLFARP